MITALRKHIPGKSLLRRAIVDPIRQARFDRDMDRAIADMRYGRGSFETLKAIWDNPGFEAPEPFLNEVCSRARERTVLECGSGVTTILAAIYGKEVWALEQDAQWARKVNRVLERNGLKAHVIHAPLKLYEGYAWYDLSRCDLPAEFGLVICDGPYIDTSWGKSVYSAWRYGTLPQLVAAGITMEEMLFDNATDPRAERVFQQWQEDYGFVSRLVGQPGWERSGTAVGRIEAYEPVSCATT